MSNVVHRVNPRFTEHKVIAQEPEELTADWKADARSYLQRVKRIPFRNRIYVDETAVFGNECKKKGRARVGTKLYYPRSRQSKKYTLHVYMTNEAVLHWELADKNATDAEVLRVFKRVKNKLERGKTLIWDRLGRSGRAKNPTAQHYNPKIAETLRECGVDLMFLPPKGKYFNPAELLFGDLKEHGIRPYFPATGENLTHAKLVKLIRKWMEDKAPGHLAGYYTARANGRDALRDRLLED